MYLRWQGASRRVQISLVGRFAETPLPVSLVVGFAETSLPIKAGALLFKRGQGLRNAPRYRGFSQQQRDSIKI